MNKRDFCNVSIRGMVAYCVMCLESYVQEIYPSRDLTPVLRLAWDIVGPEGYIDQNAGRFMEAIPEYLFEFDDYEEAEFEHLTKAEFDELRRLLNPDDSTLGLVMHRIYDIKDPRTGKTYRFVEGTTISHVEVFAGKGTRNKLRPKVAAGLSERYGGRPRDWKHVKGLGTIEAGGRFRTAEVHWFEERGAGRVEFKVKRWLD